MPLKHLLLQCLELLPLPRLHRSKHRQYRLVEGVARLCFEEGKRQWFHLYSGRERRISGSLADTIFHQYVSFGMGTGTGEKNINIVSVI